MSCWHRPDVVEQIRDAIDFERLKRIRLERSGWIRSKHWGPKTDSLLPLVNLVDSMPDLEVNCRLDAVSISSPGIVDANITRQLELIAESLKPWRKGPFQLFDLTIDSEWRSNLKWNRISECLGDLSGQKILDVGCGNGYYMFRASVQNPELILGLDPSVPFLLQFEFFQHFARKPNLQIELLGAEHLDIFMEAFDVVICMGILYHQKNPIQILKDIYGAVKTDGTALIESQIIPGHETVALFPEDRYAKARNVFFVPTESCLKNWIYRAGFRKIETVNVEPTTLEEQRKTRWSTFESLEDFLDPNDPELTIEGYPAPRRAVIKATK